MAERRKLQFATLDEVMPEVEGLLAGHETVGQWTLAEILNHLERGMRIMLDGGMKRAPWVVRRTVGPLVLRRILGSNAMPAGIKAPEPFQPRPGGEARGEAEALRATIARFGADLPEAFEHPFFGPMTRAKGIRLHCIHCAHHLGFVRPTIHA